MKVPLRWLKEFVDSSLTGDELASRLTAAGIEVAGVERIGHHWERIVIGRVERVERHPNADHLFVAEVHAGGDPLTLVTAAPNLKAGDVVPVILAGGRLAPDLVLQERNFRGIRSQGMMASGDELGISADKEHIYVLEAEAPIGANLADYLADEILEVDLKPNRPDCLGVLGVAREVAALTGQPLRDPSYPRPQGSRSVGEAIKVFVDDPDLCPRYTAAYLEGCVVKDSPLWMQRRLHQCGMRPINNLVDVTNYVMFELGQPMHAFDADKLADATVRVRRARPGEHLVTIDGVDRELTSQMLVIADAERAVGLAGVMGGLDSEISSATSRVVLESASFFGPSIRRTAQALRLSSEASKRFDKGLDPELPAPASFRALALMQELAGGSPATGLLDLRASPPEHRTISFSGTDIASLIGRDYADEEVSSILGRLGFEVRRHDGAFEATVPSWRGDVEGKADLAEEVARVSGYDSIPTLLPSGRLPAPIEEPPIKWSEATRSRLAAAGLQEIITYSLVDPRAVARLDARSPYPQVAEDADSIPVWNPMSVDRSRLRTTLLPSMLATVGENLRFQSRVWLFEIAKTFHPPLDPLPREERRLTIAMAGRRQPESWSNTAATTDFFDLKAAVEACFRALGLPLPSVEPATGPWLHPSRGAGIEAANGANVGLMGQVHPNVAARFDIENVEVYAAELNLDALIAQARDEVTVEPLPRYPAVERDLAIVLNENIPASRVEAVVRAGAGSLLERLRLFDVYQGAQVPDGQRSLAFSLAFRAPDRTLAEEEVASALATVHQELDRQLGARIRGVES